MPPHTIEKAKEVMIPRVGERVDHRSINNSNGRSEEIRAAFTPTEEEVEVGNNREEFRDGNGGNGDNFADVVIPKEAD